MSRVDQLRHAGAYLTTGSSYYSPERITQMTRVFDIMNNFSISPERCLCIGAGGRQEPFALQAKFPTLQTIVPLDLSHEALEELRAEYKVSGLNPVEADAVDLPFLPSSFDLIVAKSVMHEIASYSPGGVTSWRETLRELAYVLRPGGVLYYLDFAAPHPAIIDYSQKIEVNLKSEEAERLYDAMREHYRTFENGLWAQYHADELDSKRVQFQEDFPERSGSPLVTLGVVQAAEFFLHLPPFINDLSDAIYPPEHKHWKEMQEMYFLRDQSGLYTPQRQVELIIGAVEDQRGKARVHSQLWGNPATDSKIALHIDAYAPTITGEPLFNEKLFAQFTKKLIVAVQK